MENRIKNILYLAIGVAFLILLLLAKALRIDYPLFSYGFALLMVIGYIIYLIRKRNSDKRRLEK